MPRPASNDPRNYLLTVRLNDREKRVLDRRRGKQSLSDFVRRQILKEPAAPKK